MADSQDSRRRRDTPPAWPDDRAARADGVRVLFGCTGWPCGVIELASWAKRQGLADPVIVELPEDDSGDESFIEELTRLTPHVVGFRLEAGQLPRIKRWIAVVRRHCDAEIVLGGPTPTAHPGEVLDDCDADYVFAGEAEESFNQFLRLARQRDSRDRQPEIPGLAYRYGGRTYVNTLPRDGYERSVMDTDGVVCSKSLRCLRAKVRPVTNTQLMAANQLDWSVLRQFGRPVDGLYFTGGRGCPGACVFCAKLHGNEARAKSAEQLLEEIQAADAKVADGTLQVGRWRLFEHVDDPARSDKQVAWAAIYDEDFFLHRNRAIEFFRLWDRSPTSQRYRISLQTNPCSLLGHDGEVHPELLRWIDRVKPMVQLGAESFHPELLRRWRKRHDTRQLEVVLDALDGTRQDYTVFQLLTDFETTPEELIETLRLLVLGAYRHRRMRIASSPFTIPLYDSDTRRLLEYGGRLAPEQTRHFTDYESPQPGWMDPLVAELADAADVQLQFALNLPQRDGALLAALDAVFQKVEVLPGGDATSHLHDQALRALEQIKEARFQGAAPTRPP